MNEAALESAITSPAAQGNGSAPRGRFAGKVALITGVSDRGIGGAIVERLSGEGAAIVIASRQEPLRVMKRLKSLPQKSAFVECDVTRDDDALRSVEQCRETFGQLDLLINNAGVEMAMPLEKMTDDQWRGLIDVNLCGAIAMTRAALGCLTSPGGVIVNMSSALALGGCPGFVMYSASKAGLTGLTQSLAWELAPRGIRVVAVAPGLVDTPMTHKHIEHVNAESWKALQACHPLGIGSPHDVASAVAFLASYDARWITGVTLPLGWAPSYPLPTGVFME